MAPRSSAMPKILMQHGNVQSVQVKWLMLSMLGKDVCMKWLVKLLDYWFRPTPNKRIVRGVYD